MSRRIAELAGCTVVVGVFALLVIYLIGTRSVTETPVIVPSSEQYGIVAELANSSDEQITDLSSEIAEITIIATSGDQHRIVVELADSDDERARGLSFRSHLPDGLGMLFLFEEEGIYPFWMKDMHFSIDIIWLDADKKVTHIEESVPPDSFPQTFVSPEPSKYVLELRANGAKRYGVEIGTQLSW